MGRDARDDRTVDEQGDPREGSTLRLMWDEDAGPLWGDSGLLDSDPRWMRQALGLSDVLVDDLLTWMRDMTALHFARPPLEDWAEHKRRLDLRGEALAERVQAEVGARFVVWHHP